MPTIHKPWVREAPRHGKADDSAANLALAHRAHAAIRCTLTGRYPPSFPDMQFYHETGPVITVGDVDRTPDEALSRMPNFGRKTLKEMRVEIDRYLQRTGE